MSIDLTIQTLNRQGSSLLNRGKDYKTTLFRMLESLLSQWDLVAESELPLSEKLESQKLLAATYQSYVGPLGVDDKTASLCNRKGEGITLETDIAEYQGSFRPDIARTFKATAFDIKIVRARLSILRRALAVWDYAKTLKRRNKIDDTYLRLLSINAMADYTKGIYTAIGVHIDMENPDRNDDLAEQIFLSWFENSRQGFYEKWIKPPADSSTGNPPTDTPIKPDGESTNTTDDDTTDDDDVESDTTTDDDVEVEDVEVEPAENLKVKATPLEVAYSALKEIEISQVSTLLKDAYPQAFDRIKLVGDLFSQFEPKQQRAILSSLTQAYFPKPKGRKKTKLAG